MRNSASTRSPSSPGRARWKARRVPGMGAKKAEDFLKAMEFAKASSQRMLLGEALPLVEKIVAQLEERGVKGAVAAGSLRRMRETIGDLDILVGGFRLRQNHRRVHEIARSPPHPRRGRHKVERPDGFRPPGGPARGAAGSFGAALQYFTGSKAHNIRLRAMASSAG